LDVEIDAVQALDTRVVPWMLFAIAASARWLGGWWVLPHSGQPVDSWVPAVTTRLRLRAVLGVMHPPRQAVPPACGSRSKRSAF